MLRYTDEVFIGGDIRHDSLIASKSRHRRHTFGQECEKMNVKKQGNVEERELTEEKMNLPYLGWEEKEDKTQKAKEKYN